MRGRISRAQGSGLKYPRIGFIKTGFKNEKNFPQSTDYFIGSGKYASMFHKAYGDKPNVIQIVFPDNDPLNVCSERYEYRDDKGNLYAYGDGSDFDVWDGVKYQKYNISDHPNLMDGVTKRVPNSSTRNGGDGWSVTLTLSFIVPLVHGIVGYWQYVTKGGMSTIPKIRDLFDTVNEERGFVSGIIFDLSVEYAKSQKPDTNSKYPVVSLIPNESEENVNKVKRVNQLNK